VTCDPEERERFTWLCEQIQIERDPVKFSELVNELNDLLEAKQDRLSEKQRGFAPN